MLNMLGQCPSAGGQETDGPRVTLPPCQLSRVWKLAPVSADGKEGKCSDNNNTNWDTGCHFELPRPVTKNIENFFFF